MKGRDMYAPTQHAKNLSLSLVCPNLCATRLVSRATLSARSVLPFGYPSRTHLSLPDSPYLYGGRVTLAYVCH